MDVWEWLYIRLTCRLLVIGAWHEYTRQLKKSLYVYIYIYIDLSIHTCLRVAQCQRTSSTPIIKYTGGFLHAWCARSISFDRKIFRWCPILALPSRFSLSISLKGILSRILPVNCEEAIYCKQNLKKEIWEN